MSEGPPPAVGNADQITYWNDKAGLVWAALQARIDALFEPLTQAAMDAAELRAGLRVLDVGCGCGATLIEIIRRIGADGRVVGVDVSRPMLDVAAERIAKAGATQATLRLADAATSRFEPHGFDLVFSRFGVMFFDDPAAAFANLRGALAPEGRLAFACWQPMVENPWFAVPVAAVGPHLPPQPPSDPHAPGPFAFADPDRVRGLLARAGFQDIVITPHRTTMRWDTIEDATDFLLKVGAAARLLAEADPDTRTAAIADVRAALSAQADQDGGIGLGGAIWLVKARR